MMNVINLAKDLGRAVVADELFKEYLKAQDKFNNNEELQEKVGLFNLLKMQLNEEMHKEGADQKKVEDLNQTLQNAYEEILGAPDMVAFEDAKRAVDNLMTKVNKILTGAMNGENVDAISLEEEECGTGGCGGCTGCH